jgi:hypothetical protein
LYNTSDHLPVVLTLQTDQRFILGNEQFEVIDTWTLESTLVSNEITLSFTSEIIENLTIVISNFLGQRVSENKLTTNMNQNIDVSAFPSGLYFINAKDTNLPRLQFLKR